ncbi:MAG: aminotransferase class I/II-fold pyridoxal phosphate-dependent enzyme, partial [Verrucomicrobiota bacterium]
MPFPISLKRSKKNVIQKRVSGDDLVRLQDKYGIYYQSFDRQEGTRVWQGEVERVMLSSNDYLGLGSHPRVLEAARQALAEWGSSTTGARLANGSRRYHAELEAELADFLGVEACMVSAAGYLSCMSAVASFATRDDRIYADKNVHSSLVAGMKLSDARVERFRHNDPRDLREALEADDPARGGRMLLFEGVYSMEG